MGIKFERRYDKSKIFFQSSDVTIADADGNIKFQQLGVEHPVGWSEQAVSIYASKYFNGKQSTNTRENSVDAVIFRICNQIKEWGFEDGYFDTQGDAGNFYNDLYYILATQKASFASPYMFNVGIKENPQIASCFLTSLKDDMDSITNLFKLEGEIFKGGSGSGTNLSALRGKNEGLSNGGYSSGPVSFMKAYDTFGGVIRSGGVLRRAAISRILDCDHPDILDFITCKVKEERKGKDLLSLGYSGGIDGEALSSIAFQNSNISIRVFEKFMEAVENDDDWELINRVDRGCSSRVKAREILYEIAKSTWECGDPGIIYSDNTNRYNTLDEEIIGGNPCFEILLKPDQSCNLASINILKIINLDGEYDSSMSNRFFAELKHITRLLIIAQDIVINHSKYPNEEIKKNSIETRPLGLGITNAAAFLMANGMPYNSLAATQLISNIFSFITLHGYKTSVELAKILGYSDVPNINKVIKEHKKHLKNYKLSMEGWDILEDDIAEYGVRNCQVTVSAPTGTISFIMDADSTGIEPIFSLVKSKQLVGGGVIKTISSSLPIGLKFLGYDKKEIEDIVDFVTKNGEIVGAPHLLREEYKIFQTALSSHPEQCVSLNGHLSMLQYLFGVISGGISKTINLPSTATVDDIYNLYIDAWKRGLKAIAVYRDGSKGTQPMHTIVKKDIDSANDCEEGSNTITEYKEVIESLTEKIKETDNPKRRRLPDERKAINHKFNIGGHIGYINVGLFDDGSPGEIFLTMSKAGSVVAGLVDSLSIMASLALQYGVPLEVMVRKFSHMGFEPSGFTNNNDIKMAKSIVDYIFRWLESKFIDKDDNIIIDNKKEEIEENDSNELPLIGYIEYCLECGSQMQRSGTCWFCTQCGASSGCS